tara:strand:+ start:654 stop:1136 length:483 start_codon:yes stop_codon:yes gene_type:complete
MKNYQKIRSEFELYGYKVIDYDFDRPWGGFLVIDENQAQKFANQFFKGIDAKSLKIGGKLSPKILIVNSNSRLSWQYHLRRAEIWSIQKGEVGIVRSDNDIENKVEIFTEGDQIRLKKKERHRLIGLDNQSVVAEIWQHTDNENPSDENDIIRIQDDFGR